MIRYQIGDILRSDAEALVNPVNTFGVMGKGLALQMKQTFPANYQAYAAACKAGALVPGKLLCIQDYNLLSGSKLIINFPTKTHWRLPSEYSYIEQGLAALQLYIVENKVASLATPALGCGLGGLNWEIVKPLIVRAVGHLEAEVFVYEPI
jgi:O-acetyl-ADP-ribose deacetylase (regulator of RNase III)